MSFTSVVHCLGWTIALLAGLMILPAMTAMFENNARLAWTFAASGVLSGFFGAGFALATRRKNLTFGKREAFMFLVLVWIVLSVFAAVPLHFSSLPFHPVNAMFEAVSGLTTTGATAFVGLEAMSPAILLWRALLQWAGGLLSVVLAVSLISHLGIGGMAACHNALPRGEGASLPARMLQTAQDLFWIYVLLTLLSAVALWAGGMTGFDALCHAFSAISTGGFSTRDGGIASFHSPLIEFALMVIMLLGAMNFTLHWAAFNGRFRVFRDNIEGYYLAAAILVLVVVGGGLSLMGPPDRAFLETFRSEIFTAVSALTTTGFHNDPTGAGVAPLAPILIIGLVLVGGAAGSTTGGVRLMRVAVLFKQAQRELLRLSFPHGVRLLRLGKLRVENPVIWGVWSFFFVFILVLAALALALAYFGLDANAAIAGAVVAISNAGPFLHGVVPDAPSFHDMSHGAKITMIIGMLAGRVELLALLSLFNPAYWNR